MRSTRVLGRQGSWIAAGVLVFAARAGAQTFVSSTNIPTGSPNNTGFTENVDFADVDLDGDWDAAKAEGGDSGNSLNRLWINQGVATGNFQDQTGTRFPAVLDASRDVDFVDFDHDGDDDLYVTNSSTLANQTSRWWVNMGGAQGGTVGFFQEQTLTRWVNISVNNGTSTFSSIPSGQFLASGGFIDWSCDCVLGDLDNDGDMDLVHGSYGQNSSGLMPTRMFLNDGAGFYEEHNPSHFQLTITTMTAGDPGLWCEGTQFFGTANTTGTNCDIAGTPLGLELGDLEGDFDLDLVMGSVNEVPRVFRNRLNEISALKFRDVTWAALTVLPDAVTNAEQELGDMDNDGDLDLYGVDWPAGQIDCTTFNNGAGVFGALTSVPSSVPTDSEADWFDFDGDGDLDVLVENSAGPERIYRNAGAPSWGLSNVANALPNDATHSLGADTCDVDDDGDFDLLVANENNEAEVLLINTTNVADTSAPRIPKVQQAPNRAVGPTPTVVRAQVYDNVSWDVLRYQTVTVEYSWNSGALWHSAPAVYCGGQIFRGEIRGDIAGSIQYRVRAVDQQGNNGLSSVKSYTATGCTGNVFNYCTPGTTTSGCTATMTSGGTPSLTFTSGFVLAAQGVEGQKNGLIFYGVSGTVAVAWGPSSSFLCVKTPTQRTPSSNSGGTAGQCNGTLSIDWLAFRAANPGALGAPFAPGQEIVAQCWFRDPPSPKSTHLSDGLAFLLCP